MKIIYRGGYNKYDEESVNNSYFYEYASDINKLINDGKKVAFVTMAKDDGYYDERIQKLHGDRVDILRHDTPQVDWKVYDLLIICGGDTPRLHKSIVSKKFKLTSLKNNVVIIGDSAGAYLMSAYYFDSNDKKTVSFHKGLYPKSNIVTIAHTNNPRYTSKTLIKKVEDFAKSKKLDVLLLKENEARLYDRKSLIKFKPEEIFSF